MGKSCRKAPGAPDTLSYAVHADYAQSLNMLMQIIHRVAKCHGYDGYIRVKILAGWGKSFGEHANLAKSSLFGGKFVQH